MKKYNEMLEPVITNWDKVKEAVTVEDFFERLGICDAIHRVRKEKNCYAINCNDCKKWLKQPYQESILDDAEKGYLRAVIKPWRDKVTCIELLEYDERQEYIRIKIKNELAAVCLPNFKKGTMYKGMEKDKEYTLEDLDL